LGGLGGDEFRIEGLPRNEFLESFVSNASFETKVLKRQS
jgi:hypothetical protein